MVSLTFSGVPLSIEVAHLHGHDEHCGTEPRAYPISCFILFFFFLSLSLSILSLSLSLSLSLFWVLH